MCPKSGRSREDSEGEKVRGPTELTQSRASMNQQDTVTRCCTTCAYALAMRDRAVNGLGESNVMIKSGIEKDASLDRDLKMFACQ